MAFVEPQPQRRPAIGGFVAAGLEPVAAEFMRNFVERNELGAAFAAVRGTETLVDLWGGIADRATGRPWTADTMQIIFSGSKGLVATCVLLLIDRGQLSLDAPVAHYWPEFASAGKEQILVRDVVSHTAGLPGIESPITLQDATDASRMAALLAAQGRHSDPRAARTYHAMTFGWLCGKLVHRIDGRSIGAFFCDEIATPLGLDLWIGLPDQFEDRVATVELSSSWGTGGASRAADQAADDPLWQTVFANPLRFDAEHFPWNDPAWHRAEIPSSNAIGTARSVAALYGRLDGLLSPATFQLANQPLSTRYDPLLAQSTSFGIGFELQTDAKALGPPEDAFGHGGAGGSIHGRWSQQHVGFSYAMNHLRDEPVDERARALLCTLHAALTD